MSPYTKTRRWQRYQMDAPVQVVLWDGMSHVRVPGRVAEISAGGMGLYAGVHLQPNEPLEIEFLAPAKARVIGVVRSCSGCFLGLEFVTPLPVQDDSGQARKLTLVGRAEVAGAQNNKLGAATPAQKTVPPAVELFRRTHSACLRQKEQQMQRLRNEIEALRRAAGLLESGTQEATTTSTSQRSKRQEKKGWV
jgi:hypothetical protein